MNSKIENEEMKNIKQYVETKKEGKLISIDIEKREFIYSLNGATVKGFFENIEKWFESLLIVGTDKYEISDWWKEKNFVELSLLQEGDKIELKGETEKALLVTNNSGTDVWIPKSQLTRIG